MKQSHLGAERRILLIYKTKLAFVEEAVKGMNFHFLLKSKAALFLFLTGLYRRYLLSGSL